MSETNTARDGRKALVYILLKNGEEATTLKKGVWYAITAKASSSSKFGNLDVGDLYFCSKDESALSSGDKAVPMKKLFLGQAQSKTLSESKSTSDVTCDKDKSTNNTCNGIVSASGTINGYDLIDTAEESGINYIRTLFNDVVTYKNGVPTKKTADRTAKTLLLFVWDARDAEEGDLVSCDVAPSIITEKSRDSQYNSPQTMNLSFTVCDSDDDGVNRSYQEIEYAEEASA